MLESLYILMCIIENLRITTKSLCHNTLKFLKFENVFLKMTE